MNWSRDSLHGRLLSRLALVILVIVVISGSANYWLARHFVSHVFDSWLADTASSLAIAARGDEDDDVLRLPASLENQVRWDETDDTALMVVGTISGLIAGRADLPSPPPDAVLRHGVQLFDARLDGVPVRVASLTVLRHTGEHVTIAIAETRRKRRELAGQILIATLAPVALLSLAALGLIGAGVSRALLPLDALSEALARQEPQNLKPLPLQDAPAEIRPFVGTLNDLLARLNDALRAQRDFVADTAHQLRTPLAGLKVQLQDALRHPADAQHAELLRRLLGGVERAARLSAQLLALARAEADAKQGDAPPEVFDLVALATEAGRDWLPRLLQQGQELTLDAPAEPVMVRGRPHLMTEALDNLIDNARKYAGIGATIRIEVGSNGALTLRDSGPGFPDSLHDRLFQRFARGDHAGSDGAGLGLAIVRELMTAQGGSAARADTGPASGAAITLQLPSA